MDISFSDSAKELLKKGNTWRIILKRFAWSGPVFDLVQDEPKEDDLIVEKDNIKFVFENHLKNFMSGVKIDYLNKPDKLIVVNSVRC